MTWFFAAAATPKSGATPADASAILALFVIVVILGAVFALRTFMRTLQARKAERTVGASFTDYALEALVNAAKIDGRINDDERRAVARAIGELAGPTYNSKVVEAAFAKASLNKSELISYLASRSKVFSREQKTALLKALLSVFVADGRFDESEHAALVDYTEAVGFDRQSAPDMLRNLGKDFTRGNIT